MTQDKEDIIVYTIIIVTSFLIVGLATRHLEQGLDKDEFMKYCSKEKTELTCLLDYPKFKNGEYVYD